MSQQSYGPHNPHPLSQVRSEFIWEGKYDEYGQRREVDIAGCAMPMQKIESIDKPRQEVLENQQLTLFEQQNLRVDDFRNRLVWGDNKLVIASLLQEFRNSVDLIYIDPPFNVGYDFPIYVPIGDEGILDRERSVLEMVAFRDAWNKGSDSYLQMIHDRLTLIKDLLSANGSIFVHLDDSSAAHVKIIMDDLFGVKNFRTQIIWKRISGHGDKKGFACNYDIILHYTKSKNFIWNPQYQPLDDAYVNSAYRKIDKNGRRYSVGNSTAPGRREARVFFGQSIFPSATTSWRWSQEKIDQLIAEDRIELSKNGTPFIKLYLDENPGKAIPGIWTDIPFINAVDYQNTGYPTQKPEKLLERIIRSSSNEGDLVADLFCGSCTTGAVADRLNRRWIMADLGRYSIHTSRKRMIELQRNLHDTGKPYRSFDIYNMGRGDLQWWQQEQLQGSDSKYRHTILESFQSEVLDRAQSPLLHGLKSEVFCHVDDVDSTFTYDKARSVAQAVTDTGKSECYCLAWEFEINLRSRISGLKTEFGVDLKLIQIPREIMETSRKSALQFFEVAIFAAEPIYRNGDNGKTVDIRITQFIPDLSQVSTEELKPIRDRAIRNGIDFIDFWAIDFNWQPNKPFNHHWQDYRNRKDRSLKTVSNASYTYPKPGKYTACIKVIDAFGCDTSIAVVLDTAATKVK